MWFDLTHHLVFFILFLTGLVAGTVDAIAGGGGMISLPMLLSVGLPPHIALGTNKLQSSIGTFVATYSYYRKGWFSLKTISKGLIFGFLGALLGSLAGQIISSDVLKKIIPILLILILIYTICSPKLGADDRKPRMNEFYFYIIFGFILGFYDGFLGPGTGSFWVFSLTFFLGYNLTRATAYTKVFNLKSNLIALACFAIGQNVDYRIGLCMAAGQMIGGKLGAHLAMRNGAKLIRPIFISMVSLTIISLVYRSYAQTPFMKKAMSEINLTLMLWFAPLLMAFIVSGFYLHRKRKQYQA